VLTSLVFPAAVFGNSSRSAGMNVFSTSALKMAARLCRSVINDVVTGYILTCLGFFRVLGRVLKNVVIVKVVAKFSA